MFETGAVPLQGVNMRSLGRWDGAPFPMDGWAYGDVAWIAGATEGTARYCKTHEGKWYSVTPRHGKADVPVLITDESLIEDLEAFILINHK